MICLFNLIISLIGGYLYRQRGMNKNNRFPKLSKTIVIALFCLPVIVVLLNYNITNIFIILLVYGTTISAVSLGHGCYIDLGDGNDEDNEIFAPLLNLFFTKQNSFIRDSVGLFLTGFVVILPLSICLFFTDMNIYKILLTIFLCADAKRFSYILAKEESFLLDWIKYIPFYKNNLDGYTSVAEICYGFSVWLLILC